MSPLVIVGLALYALVLCEVVGLCRAAKRYEREDQS